MKRIPSGNQMTFWFYFAKRELSEAEVERWEAEHVLPAAVGYDPTVPRASVTQPNSAPESLVPTRKAEGVYSCVFTVVSIGLWQAQGVATTGPGAPVAASDPEQFSVF